MDQTALAIRAIASEYAKRWLWLPLAIGVVAYIVIFLLVWLIATTVSAWWWLLMIVPTFIFLVALTIWITARIIAQLVAPTMNKSQRKSAKSFVSRIDTVAEHIGTPKLVMLYRIIKDVVMRPTSGRTYIGEVASEPGEMRRAFDELRSQF